jgi:hypothetical protein
VRIIRGERKGIRTTSKESTFYRVWFREVKEITVIRVETRGGKRE